MIDRLRGEFRCVALDYPGFGLSTARPGCGYLPEEHAEVVTAFVEAVELGGITLVAQDWDGPIGLAAVEQEPAAFDGLVLANTWAWPVTGDLWLEAASYHYPAGGVCSRLQSVDRLVPTGDFAIHGLQPSRT